MRKMSDLDNIRPPYSNSTPCFLLHRERTKSRKERQDIEKIPNWGTKKMEEIKEIECGKSA